MKNKNYYNLLKQEKIIIQGHFKLNAGNHADTYIQKDNILHEYNTRSKTTKILSKICKMMMYEHLVSSHDITENDFVITGPAIAGTMFALPVANKLEMQFVYCEKQVENYKTIMHFRPSHANFIKNKKVIIIEDIITTGTNVVKTIDAILECKAEPFAVICIWNRKNWEFKPENYYNFKNQLPIKRFESIINENVNDYTPEECIQCKNNIPLDILK
jgi:orotate phosphoribosyltransferase